MRVTDIPGAREGLVAERFFVALARGDAVALAALLDERPSFANMDGPVAAVGRDALAARLAGHGPDVEYRLEWVDATPGVARAHFTLIVADVPGGMALVAELRFAGEVITSISVGEVVGTGTGPSGR